MSIDEIDFNGLSVETLAEEWMYWSEQPRKLRFGQYIASKYLEGDWPELKAEQDHIKVLRMCADRLIQSEAQG